MSPKELLYIEDALAHTQLMEMKCQEAAGKIQDTELKTYVQDLANKQTGLFNQFYSLI